LVNRQDFTEVHGQQKVKILFQCFPAIFRRLNLPETEFDHSNPSSVNVKSDCVYVDIYPGLCAFIVSTENIL